MAETNTTNPFAESETWDVSLEDILPKGNHVVTIEEAEAGDDASTGSCSLKLKLSNPTGSIRAWEYYKADFLRKIVSLFDAAGIARPQDGEFDPTDNCRLSSGCIQRLVGKQVGAVVREEADDRPDHMGETRLRVQGYVEPSKITDDMPADTRGVAQVGSSAPVADDDIPF